MEAALQSLLAQIRPLDQAAMAAARDRQAQLAKPPGSLGRLEELLSSWQGSPASPAPTSGKNTCWSLPQTTAWWPKGCPAPRRQ